MTAIMIFLVMLPLIAIIIAEIIVDGENARSMAWIIVVLFMISIILAF